MKLLEPLFLKWIDNRADPHDRALYRLAVQTGMRRGELLGLRWSDIAWEARSLTVLQQLYQRREGTGRFGLPKTRASTRTIDLSDDTVEALKGLPEAQDGQRRTWDELSQNGGLVFCREDGSPHDPRAISKRFSGQVAQAGAKLIRFHDYADVCVMPTSGLQPGRWRCPHGPGGRHNHRLSRKATMASLGG